MENTCVAFLLFTQIDEMYEAYCLQRRLRDGANKMVKAFTISPGSKEAKESLAEANRGYKECTEVRGAGEAEEYSVLASRLGFLSVQIQL